MSKKLFTIMALIALLAMVFAGCGGNTGDTNVELGKEYSTAWFSFSVVSAQMVDEYAGYTAAAGNQLWDFVITETCTYTEDIPMGTFDWYMDDDSFADYVWPFDPFEGQSEMMPSLFYLAPNESSTYHVVFEVPANLSTPTINYTEYDAEGNFGVTFSCKL